MIEPVRMQLSRAKGFKLQRASLELNGLPARKIDRTTKWGNPFRVCTALEGENFYHPSMLRFCIRRDGQIWIFDTLEEARQAAVMMFLVWLADRQRYALRWSALSAHGLQRQNLACWCPPEHACHSEVWLAFLNFPYEYRPHGDIDIPASSDEIAAMLEAIKRPKEKILSSMNLISEMNSSTIPAYLDQ